VIRSPFVICAVFTASAAGWSARLILDPRPFDPAAGALLAADLALLAVVAVAGLLVARGRWARTLAVVESTVWLILASIMPLDGPGVALTLVAGVSLAGTAGPWLTRGWLRLRPSADGPPASAVTVMLGLLAVPGVVAVVGSLGPLDWAFAAFAVVGAWGLGRGFTAALWALRTVCGPLAVTAGVASGMPRGLVSALWGLALAAASWRTDLALAVNPVAGPAPRRVPIPPELAPPEILEAAGYDDRGRPKEGK
jgi:hypothetical protein